MRRAEQVCLPGRHETGRATSALMAAVRVKQESADKLPPRPPPLSLSVCVFGVRECRRSNKECVTRQFCSSVPLTWKPPPTDEYSTHELTHFTQPNNCAGGARAHTHTPHTGDFAVNTATLIKNTIMKVYPRTRHSEAACFRFQHRRQLLVWEEVVLLRSFLTSLSLQDPLSAKLARRRWHCCSS